MRRIALFILLSVTLAACSGNGLRTLQAPSDGPDEFAVQPVKALESPGDYTALPTPTPGQSNLTDRSALNEGVIAFGGRPQTDTGTIPASDGALVQHASRLGVMANVREDLAETDAKVRKRKQRFTGIRIVPVDRYNQAYKRQSLDQDAEARKWRRAGARTPSYAPATR
jgi:hypothetical protein